jgi:hypothetical protein
MAVTPVVRQVAAKGRAASKTASRAAPARSNPAHFEHAVACLGALCGVNVLQLDQVILAEGEVALQGPSRGARREAAAAALYLRRNHDARAGRAWRAAAGWAHLHAREKPLAAVVAAAGCRGWGGTSALQSSPVRAPAGPVQRRRG